MTSYAEVAKKTWYAGRFEWRLDNPWVTKMPTEIWMQVFKWLDPKDLICLSSTCSFFRDIAFSVRPKGCAQCPDGFFMGIPSEYGGWAYPVSWLVKQVQENRFRFTNRETQIIFVAAKHVIFDTLILSRDIRQPLMHQNSFEIEENIEPASCSDDEGWYVGRKHLLEF